MDLGLRGKKAVVTASSRGLGLAVAECLAAEGADLVMSSRSRDSIERAAADIANRYGVRAIGVPADVSRQDEVDRLIERAAAEFGTVDALLCNSGGPPGGSFLSMHDENWERAFQANLMSVVRLVRGFFPYMKDNGGRIVTIASTSVKVPIPGLVLSNAMRAGVAGLMKTLSVELAEHHILVNTVGPGRIATDRIDELDNDRASKKNIPVEDIKQAFLKEIPVGRYGEPQELGKLAAYLLSPANSYMTGSTFFVDGGMVKSL